MSAFDTFIRFATIRLNDIDYRTEITPNLVTMTLTSPNLRHPILILIKDLYVGEWNYLPDHGTIYYKDLGIKQYEENMRSYSRGERTKIPKCPSAYIMFANMERENLYHEFPDLTFKERGMKIGERWNDLPDLGKLDY